MNPAWENEASLQSEIARREGEIVRQRELIFQQTSNGADISDAVAKLRHIENDLADWRVALQRLRGQTQNAPSAKNPSA